MDVADRAAWQAARAALARLRYDWNVARVALLARRWGEGASASVIALELGGVSRSAVLGKIFRLKLQQPDTKLRAVRKKASTRARRAARRGPRFGHRIALQAAFRALGLDPPPGTGAQTLDHESAGKAFGTPCGLLDLSADTCRWPVGDPGDPDFAFCGAAPLAGHPYCIGHSLIAYRADDAQGAAPAESAGTRNLPRPVRRAA
jgi:GcrA cell cycle regulator